MDYAEVTNSGAFLSPKSNLENTDQTNFLNVWKIEKPLSQLGFEGLRSQWEEKSLN